MRIPDDHLGRCKTAGSSAPGRAGIKRGPIEKSRLTGQVAIRILGCWSGGRGANGRRAFI